MWRGRPRPRNGKMSKTRRSRRIFTWCGNGEANEPDGERQPQRQERSAPKGQHNLAQDVSPGQAQKKDSGPIWMQPHWKTRTAHVTRPHRRNGKTDGVPHPFRVLCERVGACASAPKGRHNLAQDVSPGYSQKKTQAPPRRNTTQDLHAPRRHPPGRDEALPPHRKGCPPFSHPVRKSALLLPSSHQPHRIHIHNHLRPRNLLLRRIDEHRS
jgi:hypothetical protein